MCDISPEQEVTTFSNEELLGRLLSNHEEYIRILTNDGCVLSRELRLVQILENEILRRMSAHNEPPRV